jgi:hypothetical protein
MLFILESFNKKYLQSAYLMAKSIGAENRLFYEFLNSIPNVLKTALKKHKLHASYEENLVKWHYEVDLKTTNLSVLATDTNSNVTYRATFLKLDKISFSNIDINGISLGEFEVKTPNNCYDQKFLKQTKEPVFVKPVCYLFTLHKKENEFVVKTNNTLCNETFETYFNNELCPISNEYEK